MNRDPLSLRSFRVLTGAILIVWLVLPLVPLAIWSFARGWRFPDLLPQQWSLSAWRYALSDTSGVLDSLGLTIGISLGATLLSIMIGVPAGRARPVGLTASDTSRCPAPPPVPRVDGHCCLFDHRRMV